MSPKDPWLDGPKESRGGRRRKKSTLAAGDKEEDEVPIPNKRLVVLFCFLLLPSRCGGTTEQM